MQKNLEKTKKRNSQKATAVKIVAELCGVSTRTVERVTEGTQSNEEVLNTYMTYNEEHNLLVQKLKQMVPLV